MNQVANWDFVNGTTPNTTLLVDNKVLFEKQFGSRKKYLTADDRFSFISSVSKAMDEHDLWWFGNMYRSDQSV